jgi:hypothetical protein
MKRQQRRPFADFWPVDEQWKRRLQCEMKRRALSRGALAGKIKCDPSAITVLFRSRTKQSRLVVAIHRELGWLPPMTVPLGDSRLYRLIQSWPTLTVQQRDVLGQLAELFHRSRGMNERPHPPELTHPSKEHA